jgi:hypothetical protein
MREHASTVAANAWAELPRPIFGLAVFARTYFSLKYISRKQYTY